MKRCIVSCAVGDRYERYGRHLVETLERQGCGAQIKVWYDGWPPGSPKHQDLHYAFKFWAVKWALDQGYDQVMWLDAGSRAVAPVAPVWDAVVARGAYVVAGTEPLGEWISDQALAYFGRTRDEAFKLYLCGGAIVGLDLCSRNGLMFYKRWEELATRTRLFMSTHSKYAPDKMRSLFVLDGSDASGQFGDIASTDPRFKGHRSDEACFSLILDEMGLKPGNVYEWNNYIKTGYSLEDK